MAILVSNEIYSAICRELSNAEESVQIMSAYGKVEAISSIIEKVKPSIQSKRIMLRFRFDDLTKGSTDFDVLELCMKHGWKVYIRFDLHAKTYVVDNKRGIIGSANATSSGMALTRTPNYEMAALVAIENEDLGKINSLFNDAICVDDELMAKLHSEFSNINLQASDTVPHQWSKEITEKFNPNIETLFSHELPEKSHYVSGDYIQFLDIAYLGEKDFLKSCLRWSSCYLWLLRQLADNNGELYFGELSVRLHDSIIADPKPFRKDIKLLLSNLLQLISELDMPEINIDRPNHSQRVSLR